MKTHSARLLTLALIGGVAAPAAAQDHTDMLERVIPAVVTVGIMAADDAATAAFGFTDDTEEREASTIAYEAPLYLSGMNSTGSGFVIERERRLFVVTNAHVIATADPDGIYVFSHERNRYQARLIGADTHWDVAVLELERSTAPELRPIGIRTTALRVGTSVYAIGNPQGIRPYTITRGIVSGLNRATGTAGNGYIQHDAGIVFGNSGGPLVGTDGRVVGLNTAIGSHDGSPLTYIGLALEGSRLERVVSDIIITGRVRRPYLGLYLQAQRMPDGRAGIVLKDTLPGSPAAAAQPPVGDGWELISVNGEEITGFRQLTASLELISPTAPIELTLRKSGETRTAVVRPRMLDDQLLTGIGSWVLEHRLGITTTSDLSILYAPEEPPRKWNVLTSSAGGTQSAAATPSRAPRRGDEILQAGIITKNAFDLYRAGSLKDIGVISRMVMPDGWLTLVLYDGDDIRAVTTLVYASTVL